MVILFMSMDTKFPSPGEASDIGLKSYSHGRDNYPKGTNFLNEDLESLRQEIILAGE